MSPVYACIAVREFPAQAMLRLRPDRRIAPCAILDGAAPLETICASNAQARRLGIAAGMTRVEAETLPEVTLLRRSLEEEQSARAALLGCAAGYTPRVEECPRGVAYLCVLDILGTTQMFGPPAQLAASLLKNLRNVGFAATVAVAANYHAARSLAWARNSGVCVIPAGQERAALAPLPLAVLEMSQQHAATFADWGIRTLGELSSLPEHALVARIGQEGKRLRQLALGAAPHLFVPLEEPLALLETMELDSPVELLDSLLFVLRVLLEQLIARATHQLVVLAAVTVTLALEGGAEHRCSIRPALATNDLSLWMKLAQLELAAHPPQAPILTAIVAGEPGNRSKVQLGLFTPQTPEPGRLEVTLARLRALVGEEGVGMPVLNETHRPGSFHLEPFRMPAPPRDLPQPDGPTRCAMRILRPPEPLFVALSGKEPASFHFRGARYRVERAYGPWIASGDWWNQTLWAVQQWDVIACDGDSGWLYGCMVFDPQQKSWQMVGLYD